MGIVSLCQIINENHELKSSVRKPRRGANVNREEDKIYTDIDDEYYLHMEMEPSITEYVTRKEEDIEEGEVIKTVKCICEHCGYPVLVRSSSLFCVSRKFIRNIEL